MDTRRGTCQEEGPLIAKSPWKSCHSVFHDPVASSSSGPAQRPRVVDSIERMPSSAHQSTKLLPIVSLGKQCKVRSRFESWGSTDTPLAAWPDLHPHPLSTTRRPIVPAPEAIEVTSASQKQKPLLGRHSSASCEPASPYPLQIGLPLPYCFRKTCSLGQGHLGVSGRRKPAQGSDAVWPSLDKLPHCPDERE